VSVITGRGESTPLAEPEPARAPVRVRRARKAAPAEPPVEVAAPSGAADDSGPASGNGGPAAPSRSW